MEKENREIEGEKIRTPMHKDTIYRITLITTFLVSGIFVIKDMIGGSWDGVLVIGIALIVFALGVFLSKVFGLRQDIRYIGVSLSLLILIAMIAIFSGESYSEDFCLLLAAIGLTGLYLRPLYPRLQTVLADILLVIMYVCAPQKSGGLSQFILCAVTFNVAAIMICLVIDRGRAFIIKSEQRALEVEEAFRSLSTINRELNHNVQATHERIGDMQEASRVVERQTAELQDDSMNIADGVSETITTCDEARERVGVTKGQIESLREEVAHFEQVLTANAKNLEHMASEITTVKQSSAETSNVFGAIQAQMEQIVTVMGQLNSITASTTMLALNASIEAARAGEAGAGFAVVASKVQELAVDSSECSAKVQGVVADMQRQVDITMEQMQKSTINIDNSLESLAELKESFVKLTENFDVLYQNIEEENSSVSEVEISFDHIQQKVSAMREYTDKNHTSVEAIADSVKVYGDNMRLVEEDTENLKKLAESMEFEVTEQDE